MEKTDALLPGICAEFNILGPHLKIKTGYLAFYLEVAVKGISWQELDSFKSN